MSDTLEFTGVTLTVGADATSVIHCKHDCLGNNLIESSRSLLRAWPGVMAPTPKVSSRLSILIFKQRVTEHTTKVNGKNSARVEGSQQRGHDSTLLKVSFDGFSLDCCSCSALGKSGRNKGETEDGKRSSWNNHLGGTRKKE